MKALILKDLCNMKKSLKSTVLFLLGYGLLMAVVGGQGTGFFCAFFSVYCITLSMGSFSYDEQAKWDAYALTMPLSRKTIILSKYVLGLVLVLGCQAAISLFWLLQRFLRPAEALPPGEFLIVMLAVLLFSLLMQAVLLPLIVRLGPEKGRNAMYLTYLAVAAFVVMGAKIDPQDALERLDMAAPGSVALALTGAGLPFALLCLFVSFRLSLGAYLRREF